jgi:hypothetical protein
MGFLAASLLFCVAWLDALIAVCGESLKTYVREVWRFGSQLVSLLAVFLLRFMHRGAYEYQLQRRHRIRRADSMSAASAALTRDEPRHAQHALPGAQRRAGALADALFDVDDGGNDGVDSAAGDGYCHDGVRNVFDDVVRVEVEDDDALARLDVDVDTATVATAGNDDGDADAGGGGDDDDGSDDLSSMRRARSASIKRDVSDARDGVTTALTVGAPARTIRQEAVHEHEQAITGLLEDVLVSILLTIERATNTLRYVLGFVADVLRGYDASERHKRQALRRRGSVLSLAVAKPAPTLLETLQQRNLAAALSKNEYLSMRSSLQDMRVLVAHAGYPYSRHRVVTSDGYVLLLERIGRKDSKRAMLLQHGVLDSSYTWLAAGAQRSLAFRAFDSGFDVFLGNLRGTQFSRGHVDPHISSAEYWDFCVDDHAAHDLPAFLDAIRHLKQKELVGVARDDIEVSVIAHSMGAACVLAYLVQSGMCHREPGIARAILLAPAGYHVTAPLLCRLTGPLISLALRFLPIHSFRLAWPTVRRLTTKLMADIRGSSAAGALFVAALTRLLGGQLRPANEHHPFGALPDLARIMTESATSARVFKQFWQMWSHRRFEAFDYGPAENLKRYGTVEPLDYMAHYDVIDRPVFFVLGLDDKLIEPSSVIGQYRALLRSHPDAPSRTHIKALPNAGHIELTLSPDERAISWILETLGAR